MRFERGIWDEGLGCVFVATERLAGRAPDLDDPSAMETSVDAIDLASGDIRWRVSGPGVPTGIFGRSIILIHWQPGAPILLVRLLDGDTGREAATYPLPLPTWARLGTHISVLSAGEDKGRLAVLWHGKSTYAGGAPPPSEIARQYARDEGGGFIIDPANGAATAVPAAALARIAPAPTSAAEPIAAVPAGETLVGHVGAALLTLHLAAAGEDTLPPGSATLTLTARNATDLSILWQRHVRDVILRLPPPLPP